MRCCRHIPVPSDWSVGVEPRTFAARQHIAAAAAAAAADGVAAAVVCAPLEVGTAAGLSLVNLYRSTFDSAQRVRK